MSLTSQSSSASGRNSVSGSQAEDQLLPAATPATSFSPGRSSYLHPAFHRYLLQTGQALSLIGFGLVYVRIQSTSCFTFHWVVAVTKRNYVLSITRTQSQAPHFLEWTSLSIMIL